ncbi:MAG: penicillin-binding transpeptidase domain-containing protein [Marmoricola sp.]
MPPRTRMVVPALLVLALALAGCGKDSTKDPAAQKAADALAAGLSAYDASKIAFSDTAGATAFTDLVGPLKSFASDVRAGDVKVSGSTATTELSWTMDRDGARWKHTTTARLTKAGGTWQVDWSPAIVESSLVAGETISVTGLNARRGDILGRGDKALVEPRPVVRFGIDKAQAGAAAVTSAGRLAQAVGISAAPYVKLVTKAGPKAFVPALVVRRGEVSSGLIGRVVAIPGARAISDHLPLAPTKDFAAALLGTVGPATAEIIKDSKGRLRVGDDAGLSGLEARYDEQLGGTPGVKVSAVPAKGSSAAPRELFSAAAVPGDPLKLTLDEKLQATAQTLLDRYGPASALVAIKPSTGEILVAASGPGSKGYNTATFGQYAPGSTFKIVSSLALLRAGMKPDSPVSCPLSVVVNGKKFKNYSDYPSNRIGQITLRDAVANSCNTAFISSRAKVKGTALGDAAAALGFGVDHDLGFPAYFGQAPAPSGETEGAADLIGQGKILASPMAMATVVASVVRGSTVVPWLVQGAEKRTADPKVPLTKAEAASLRGLMHAVVTDGSGSFLQAIEPPSIIAKTGTAEFGSTPPLPTHTWMVGAQGDLAVAVFVDRGQSGSGTAGPVLEAFLKAAK